MARDSIIDLKRKISQLERALMSEADLAQIASQFLRLTETDPRIIARSERHELTPVLRKALAEIGQVALGREVPLHMAALLRLPRWHLVHGTVFLGDRPAAVLYFENLGVGLASVVLDASGSMHCTRFTAVACPPEMN